MLAISISVLSKISKIRKKEKRNVEWFTHFFLGWIRLEILAFDIGIDVNHAVLDIRKRGFDFIV